MTEDKIFQEIIQGMKGRISMIMTGFVQNVVMITLVGEKDVTNVMLQKRVVADLKEQIDGVTKVEMNVLEII